MHRSDMGVSQCLISEQQTDGGVPWVLNWLAPWPRGVGLPPWRGAGGCISKYVQQHLKF